MASVISTDSALPPSVSSLSQGTG